MVDQSGDTGCEKISSCTECFYIFEHIFFRVYPTFILTAYLDSSGKKLSRNVYFSYLRVYNSRDTTIKAKTHILPENLGICV